MLLLLAPYIKTIGGTETTYGTLTAAAAIPTAFALGLLIRYPRRVRPHALLAVTSLIYGVAALGVAGVHGTGVQLILLGLVLGTSWAAAYTVAPMIVSELVGDENRAEYIGYVTGTIQVGFGVGPVLGNALHSAGMSYSQVFLVAAGCSGVAVVLVLVLRARQQQLARVRPEVDDPAAPGAEAEAAESGGTESGGADAQAAAPGATTTTEGEVGLLRGLGSIVRSPAVVPLLMTLLAGCLFTSMNSFQTTFADSRHLSFDFFYVSYTVTVVVVRLVVARLLTDSSSDRVVLWSSLGMVVAVVAFLLVGQNAALYVLASVLLGASYGLALPAFQARSVNLAKPEDKPRMLPLVGLVFEVSILVFPLIAGSIVDASSYRGLFVVLLFFVVAVAALGMRRPRRSAPAARPAEEPT